MKTKNTRIFWLVENAILAIIMQIILMQWFFKQWTAFWVTQFNFHVFNFFIFQAQQTRQKFLSENLVKVSKGTKEGNDEDGEQGQTDTAENAADTGVEQCQNSLDFLAKFEKKSFQPFLNRHYPKTIWRNME